MKSQKTRLTALDGLRGLAMILVFLNHVSSSSIETFFPDYLRQLVSIIFYSGVTGVTFLFILSGFLMAYLYPHPKSIVSFLQKRYTRIFPLFVGMCSIVFWLSISSDLTILARLGISGLIPIIFYIIWAGVIKKINSFKLSRAIFLGFIALQIVVGLFYYLWIMRHSALAFSQLPLVMHGASIFLVNSTLTLPIGNYIPMIDGVYWSLAAEVLFYVLYAIIAIPIILFLPRSRKIITAVIIALIPAFIGINILSQRLLSLSMLQVPLFYYFVTGITLGHIQRKKPDWIKSFSNKFAGIFFLIPLVYFVVIIFGKDLLFFYLSRQFDPWIHILMAIPFTLAVAFALDTKNSLGSFLNSRLLRFIGSISYSIYLSHSTIINLVQPLLPSENIFTNIISVVLIFLLTVVVSSILHFLLERPYFSADQPIKNIVKEKFSPIYSKAKIIFVSVFVLYFLAVFLAFQSNFNFFSKQEEYSNSVFTFPKISNNESKISMIVYKHVLLKLRAADNNLGIVAMHIVHQTSLSPSRVSPELLVKVKEDGSSNWYSITSYPLTYVKDVVDYPFGFPEISNSKNKTYIIELNLENGTKDDYLILDTTNKSIKSIYPFSKSKLLNPSVFLMFINNKVENTYNSTDAKYAMLAILPLLILFLYLGLKREENAIIYD